MRKYVLAAFMLLTVSGSMAATPQNKARKPQTELTDSTRRDAIEAFSDTTATSVDSTSSRTIVYDEDDVKEVLKQITTSLDGDDILGMLFVLAILFLLFVLSPIGIIIALFYFINRNRRDKYRLAQMAMQNGQPIPDELLREQMEPRDNSNIREGIRQACLGIGLMILLGIIIGKLGFGIGALVFFIGLGKIIISKYVDKTADGNASHEGSYDRSADGDDNRA